MASFLERYKERKRKPLEGAISLKEYTSLYSSNQSFPLEFIDLRVWGDGPRYRDVSFFLIDEEIDEDNNVIKLFFEGGGECLIEKPSDIFRNDKILKIADAEKITWKRYYGRKQCSEELMVAEYMRLNDSNVHVSKKSKYHPWEGIIETSGEIAFRGEFPRMDPTRVRPELDS